MTSRGTSSGICDDEPVEACPPSTVYRLQKFTRRHQTAVIATAAVGLALILGAGVATGQAYRATKAEKVAEEQLQIANEQQRLAKQQAQLAKKQRQAGRRPASARGGNVGTGYLWSGSFQPANRP